MTGPVFALCEEKRGKQRELRYMGETRVVVEYELPLSEIVLDFYDRLKSVSRGYASMEYELIDFRPSELAKLDIRINGDPVDALSVIVHRDKAYYRWRDLAAKMKELIPRQMFEGVIKASIGSKVIARETAKGLRQSGTAKWDGGHITRNSKLQQ